MDDVLHIIITSFFCVLGVLCTVFGSSGNNNIKKINKEAIRLFIYFMALWYFLESQTSFQILNWERDDGLIDIKLIRFLSSFTVTLSFILLVVYKITENGLNVIAYFILSVFINISIILSVVLFEKKARIIWIVIAFIFSFITIINLVKLTFNTAIVHVNFARSIILFISTYIAFFLFTTLWSPFHQNLITLQTYEIIMSVVDVLFSIFCALPIIHYGWAVFHQRHEVRVSPGYIKSLFNYCIDEEQRQKLRDELHQFK